MINQILTPETIEMIEIAANYIPELLVTGVTGGFVYLVKRYLEKQDKRFESLTGDFKSFSKDLLEQLHILIVSQATDNEKHRNTDNRLKKVDKSIDELYDRSNDANIRITKLEK